jgi:hypothetical protein
MSEAPSPPPRRTGSGLSTLAKVLLFAVLPIVIALALVAVVLSSFVFSGTDIRRTEQVEARSEVLVTVDNAEVRVSPSPDDDVHVQMSGFHWGREPRLIAGVDGDRTLVDGGCRGGWFGICRITITVSLPADLPLVVEGNNGAISVEELTGPLTLGTNNGAITISDSAGRIEARTSNGRIEIEDSSSTQVGASTTNGRIDLNFDGAPITVDARTTNGAVTIAVPVDGYEYRVDTGTVNGSVNDSEVPNDNDSNRSIFVRTTNGGVTIEPSDN